jgi:glycosyltransferase involved in cell wall biosynthesis
LLLRAAAELVTKDISLIICAVGDGPRRAHLERLAADLRITDRMMWAGEVNDGARVATAFDVAVLCSEWEGLPLAALEVMSAGVPLIATAVGGLPELLADGAGVLVPPGDAHALADAIDTLHGQPAAASRIGAAGRRRVCARHDSASIVATLEGIYGDVAAVAEVASP